MGGVLLFCPILREGWSWIHQNRCCCPSKWDAVNIFSPNTPTLVLLHQYHHLTHHHAYLLSPSFSDLTTICIFFVVLVVLAFRVSAHRHLPLLCSPRATVSFVPVISSLTIARTFFFYGTRTQPPISAIIFLFLSFYATNLLLISVATAS